MEREYLIRRLKAARALGGFTKPAALAKHPLLVENGIKDWRIREIESANGRTDVRPMELAIIARACELPEEFFSAPFARMAESSDRELLERIEAEATRTRERVEGFLSEVGASRVTQAVRDAAQASEEQSDESLGQSQATENP